MYPHGMDYRWCTYVIGRRLFIHRSWTGQGIFEAEFKPASDGWHVVSALVESGDVKLIRRQDRPRFVQPAKSGHRHRCKLGHCQRIKQA
jgi:hypothetical protein